MIFYQTFNHSFGIMRDSIVSGIEDHKTGSEFVRTFGRPLVT